MDRTPIEAYSARYGVTFDGISPLGLTGSTDC